MPDTVDLEWDNPMRCWPAGDFYVQISRTRDFSDMVWYGVSHEKEAVWISAAPPMFEDCTWYFWRVRPDPAGGGEGPYSDTWSFRYTTSELLCSLDLGLTDIPPEVLVPPSVRLLVDANCRSGPSLDFPLLSILPAGGQYEIEGRNTAGDSWMVFDPAIDNTCWVFGDLVEVLGDASGLMIIDPVPPSTPVPVVCSMYGLDRGSCDRDPSCWWNPIGGVGNGGCENR